MPRDLNKVFEQIYRKEVWGKGKGSGTGSSPEYCRDYLTFLLSTIVQQAKVLDIGCGDHQLYAEFPELKKWQYLGIDASEQALEAAANRYEQPPPLILAHTNEEIAGIVKNFDPDFILLKDVMMHWNDEEIHAFLDMLCPMTNAVIIASHNYKYFRKPSMNDEPRKLDRYSWAPVPEDHPAMVKHGFVGVRYYPRGKYKLISVRR